MALKLTKIRSVKRTHGRRIGKGSNRKLSLAAESKQEAGNHWQQKASRKLAGCSWRHWEGSRMALREFQMASGAPRNSSGRHKKTGNCGLATAEAILDDKQCLYQPYAMLMLCSRFPLGFKSTCELVNVDFALVLYAFFADWKQSRGYV